MTKMHRIARRFEDRIAEDLGARRTLMSGGSKFDKADVRSEKRYQATDDGVVPVSDGVQLRVEAKTTSSGAYTFTTQDWDDLEKAALGAIQEPVFAVSFVDAKQDYVLIRASFAALLGFAADMPVTIKKSWSLNARRLLLGTQRRRVHLLGSKRKPVLVVLDYEAFLSALERLNVQDHSGAPA